MDSEYVTVVDPIDDPASLSEQTLKSIFEAILFAASEPISVQQFQAVLPDLDARTIRKVLVELGDDYQQMQRSFHLTEIANGYQICTRPQYSEWIQQFYTQQVRVTLTPFCFRDSRNSRLQAACYAGRRRSDSRRKQ